MRPSHLTLLTVLCCFPGSVFGQEQIAKSRIVSAGVFKNGLTFIKSEITVPGAGTYRFENAPEPVHGTFWIESNCKVESAVKMREVEVATQIGAQASLQEELAGKSVTIHFKDGARAKITGSVARVKAGPAGSGFLILKTAKGHSYVNPSEIAALDVEDKDEVVKQRRPTLVLTVDKAEKKPIIFVTYLTHGLGWASSYLVDITDQKQLSIEMSAVLRNDLAKLEDADIKLISGFSSVQFAHVPSPLSPKTTFDKFLAALSTGRDDSSGNGMLTQVNFTSNTITSNPRVRNLSATPDGEGVDLHFQSIGKRSLNEGEALSLTVGKAKIDYERIVEWTANPARGDKGEASIEDIWDVLHFKNPFTFPMTAAPAMVMEKGQFNGQRACYWANVGEETSLRITRSLSVRTLAQEREEGKKDKLETIKIGNATYQIVTVQGELIVNNHRKQAVKMMVRRTINGKVLSTEGDPKQLPRQEGLSAINPSQDLLWTLNLSSGEEKTLRYRYSFLTGGAHW